MDPLAETKEVVLATATTVLPENKAKPVLTITSAWKEIIEDGEIKYEVDFDDSDDPANPLNWPRRYKWMVISMISFMTLIVNFSTIMCAPATGIIMQEFKTESKIYNTIIVTIFEVGKALAPLCMAPLSEIFGRRPVYNIANCLFVIFSIAGAVSTNMGQLIAFRLLSGVAVASTVLNPCLVGDMFRVEESGSAMSLMSLPPLLGPVIGPIIGGYMSTSLGWRSTFWFTAISVGVLQIIFCFAYHESYKPRILVRRAAELQKQHGGHFTTKYEKTRDSTILASLVRPAYLLLVLPVLFLLSIYVAAAVAYFYILLTSLTGTFTMVYGFSIEDASLTFLGLSLGLAIGMLGCKFTMDKRVKALRSKNSLTPEAARLPYILVGAVFMPAGLLLYGWSIIFKLHWTAPVLGLALVGISLALALVPGASYLVDAFGIHSGSALAAMIFTRNLVGALVPLAGPALYARLNVGWGSSVLALVAIVMTSGPLYVLCCGRRLREASRVKIET